MTSRRFFVSELAARWVVGREVVVVLSLEDAFELAQGHWVERSRRAGIRAPEASSEALYFYLTSCQGPNVTNCKKERYRRLNPA